MEIKDLHENTLVITDLKAYWTDIYNKLLCLQNNKNDGTSL